MATIGDRIRERRLQLNWTLEKLSTEAGVSKGFLSDLETGRRKGAGGQILSEIARVLGVSLDHIISGGSSTLQGESVQIPASLVAFAQQAGLTFAQALLVLQLRRQIIAHRSNSKSDDLELFDWKPFYEAIKPHMK